MGVLKVNVNAKILVDLGNSETRVGVEVQGNYRTLVLSNGFYAFLEDMQISRDYNNHESTIFQYQGQYYAWGEIVRNEFSGSTLRPAAYTRKCEQLTSYLSFNLIFIKVIDMISNDLGKSPKDINWDFQVGVLVPPLEHQSSADNMKDLVTSITSVSCVTPSKYTIPIKISSVSVYPEGLVAYTAAMFDIVGDKRVLVPENKKFKQGYVLIMDIGAGTTDVALVKDGKFVSSTKNTFNKGGNFVAEKCRPLIQSKYGFRPSDISEVVKRGILLDGAVEHDVSDILTQAKEQYVQVISALIREYIEGLDISMREIKGILMIGGGTLPIVRDNEIVSPSLSGYLIKFLKEVAPNVEQVSLHGVDPRMANLQGLHIMSV